MSQTSSPHAADPQPPSVAGSASPGGQSLVRRILNGPGRHVVTIACLVVVVVNVAITLGAIPPKDPPDTQARLRAAGGPVALYAGLEGERIHWLKPGTTVALGDISRAEGIARYPIHVTLEEGTNIEGFVDAADLVPEDVDRARRNLQRR